MLQRLGVLGLGLMLVGPLPLHATPEPDYSARAVDLQIDQGLVRSSPLLKRWLKNPPDLLHEIDTTPAFPTRFQLFVSSVPSRAGDTEWNASLQDVFIASSSVSLSTEYTQSLNTENRQWGVLTRVYLLPLGSHLNIAPVFGYRKLLIDGVSLAGTEIGTRFVIAAPLAADLSLSQSLVLAETPVGRTQLALGYAISPGLRLSAQILWQNSVIRQDTSYGFGLEVVN